MNFCNALVNTSTGLDAITITPSNPDATICSDISLTTLMFLSTKSNLVSPGFCGSPPAITITSASAHCSYPPEVTLIGGTKAPPWFKSIASPSAFSGKKSINPNSSHTPLEYS